MAEILLSLTIIGVVAAITLPSLTGNINERTWNTQKKALYARMSQAISLMPALNGYGNLEDGDPNNVAETFITAGLSKVYKINNICAPGHLSDCGVASNIKDLNGSLAFASYPETLVGLNSMFNGDFVYSSTGETHGWRQTDTKAAAFETAQGESIVLYYNPKCNAEKINTNRSGLIMAQGKVCVNMIFDLNGTKGPNTYGKDIGFITAIYGTDSVVAMPTVANPKMLNSTLTDQYNAARLCKQFEDDARLPNIEELIAAFTNRKLFGMDVLPRHYWSNNVQNTQPTKAWALVMHHGGVISYDRGGADGNCYSLCVQR